MSWIVWVVICAGVMLAMIYGLATAQSRIGKKRCPACGERIPSKATVCGSCQTEQG